MIHFLKNTPETTYKDDKPAFTYNTDWWWVIDMEPLICMYKNYLNMKQFNSSWTFCGFKQS